MPEYTVTWTIQLEAESLEAAAREALLLQRDPKSTATTFAVDGKRITVEDEDAHIKPGDNEPLEAAGVPEFAGEDPFGEPTQTFRIELRFDFTGTKAGAELAARAAASRIENAEITAIFDENFDDA